MAVAAGSAVVAVAEAIVVAVGDTEATAAVAVVGAAAAAGIRAGSLLENSDFRKAASAMWPSRPVLLVPF